MFTWSILVSSQNIPCKIEKIRQYQTKAVVHAYIASKLDSNNSLLVGASSFQLQKLQSSKMKQRDKCLALIPAPATNINEGKM